MSGSASQHTKLARVDRLSPPASLAPLALRLAGPLFGLLVIAWVGAGSLTHSGIDPLRLASTASPPWRLLAASCVWVAVAAGLFEVASPVFRRLPALTLLASPDRAARFSIGVLGSAAVVALAVLDISSRGSSTAYFAALRPLDYAASIGALAFSGWSLARLIAVASRSNPTYREYLEFRRSSDGRDGSPASLLLRAGIRKRLILSFVGLALVVIAVLSTVLLNSFSRTILQAVIANGSSLTDRAASVIKANLGDDIAISDYFAIEKKKNEESSFRFNSLTFYRRTPRSDFLAATQSTLPALIGTELPPVHRAATAPTHRYDAQRGVFEFLAPVTLSNVLVGYVFADYSRDRIYEPYFRTQVRVVLVAAFFLYVTVFTIYVFGNNIVFPILFLRMSVNRISGALSSMIHGQVRVSADLLRYEDKVPTRDEIKMLSGEIGNMTTVIRGIIPYISASTLKQAEGAQPTSRTRELAFLFTDVRGFTSLCEGMSPDEIVKILNHYLQLQTDIILDHRGDIDKFVGDEIMGVFEGPSREINACRAAMAIRTAMARDRELKEAEKRQLISIGIGLNTGPVVFGSVGAKDRMDFTSIGDTVNVAARLEGANKTYGTKSLMTQMVHEKVKDSFLCREIDLMTVAGKSRPVRIYEVLQDRTKASAKLSALAQSFEKGLAYYRRRKWDLASTVFEVLADRLHDEPSRLYLKRVALFKANPPPPDWDGVFALTVK